MDEDTNFQRDLMNCINFILPELFFNTLLNMEPNFDIAALLILGTSKFANNPYNPYNLATEFKTNSRPKLSNCTTSQYHISFFFSFLSIFHNISRWK